VIDLGTGKQLANKKFDFEAAGLSLSLLAAPVPKTASADWKTAIRDREFDYHRNGMRPHAIPSVKAARKAGFVAEFVEDPEGCDGVFAFAKKDGPKLTVRGHTYSTAVVRGDALYVADFTRGLVAGGRIAAYDLTTGKKGWEKYFGGLGSTCGDYLTIAVEEHPTAKGAFALVATGWNVAVAFIEVLDLGTGKQLALKKRQPDADDPAP
jgi:hypothetical protein